MRKRDLVTQFRSYADSPIKGSEYVPIHQSTLREAADRLERMEAALTRLRTARDMLRTRETVDWWARVGRCANDNRGWGVWR